MKYIHLIIFLGLAVISAVYSKLDKTGILIDDTDPVTLGKIHVGSVSVHAPITPALVGNENNVMLEVKVYTAGVELPLTVNELSIDAANSTNNVDVENFRVFYTGNSPRFSTENQFGNDISNVRDGLFKGEQSLKHGVNYFWVSCQLKSSANLLNKVGVRCNYIDISGKKVNLASSSRANKRIGYALRKHNDDGIDTYRIPGLATTNRGTLIAVYDNRRNGSVDLQADVDIGMSRSTDGGRSWKPMKVIMDMGNWGGKPQDQNGIGDPSILVDRTNNTIWVAAVWAHGHPGERNWWASRPGLEPETTSQFMLVKSEDDGITWSEPINITKQIKDPKWHLLLQGPGKGITLNDGTLVFPAQFKDENQIPHSTIIYSRDQGQTWQIGTGAKSNTTEAQVVELSDGSLMLNMRDNRGTGPQGRNGTGARSVAVTNDLGKTWVEHPTSGKALPEPVCMASLVKHTYKNNDLLLFSNPVDQYARHHMTIKISLDEGMTWPEKYHFLLDEGLGRGYSCLTTIDEHTVGILYEGSQADLVFEMVKLEEILGDTIN